MRIAPCESTPRRLAHTSTSAVVAAPSAVMPLSTKMSVKKRASSAWSTRMSLSSSRPPNNAPARPQRRGDFHPAAMILDRML
jgi:hypothetical protein